MSAPPSLIADTEDEKTNTLALLLPHLALFEGPQLRLLKEHYSQFGQIVHWAPVRGFGRVIIVYATDEEAGTAKREGDRLFLDVDLGDEVGRKGEGIGHKRSKSQPAHGYVVGS
jgi:calcipressin-2